MAVTKAIQGLDIMIRNKELLKTKLDDLSKSTNDNSSCKTLLSSLTESLQFDVQVLSRIKSNLLPDQKRTKIVCKHAKKYHDITKDGQKYCMNCNADL